MFFSRIRIRPDATSSPEFWKIVTGPYQIHSMVWDLFADPEHQDRDFLYRVDTVNGRPVIYSVSHRSPVYMGNLWSVETKEYHPVLFNGQRLSFALRANPIRTRSTDSDENGKRIQKRHDVVMDAKWALRQGGSTNSIRVADLVQNEGFRWLHDKGTKHGFEVESHQVIAGSYRQHSFYQGTKNRLVSLSTIDFNGVLEVTDTNLFRNALMNGIGPAKGFGCGMMMVKPV